MLIYKMIQPAFNYGNIRKMAPIFEKKTLQLTEYWKQEIKDKNVDSLEVDIVKYGSQATRRK
jgi:hypothetical protein